MERGFYWVDAPDHGVTVAFCSGRDGIDSGFRIAGKYYQKHEVIVIEYIEPSAAVLAYEQRMDNEEKNNT